MDKSSLGWSPTRLGRLITRSPEWQLTLQDNRFEIYIDGQRQLGSVLELDYLVINNGLLWSDFNWLCINGEYKRLDGLSNQDATILLEAINHNIDSENRRVSLEEKRAKFKQCAIALQQWAEKFTHKVETAFIQRGWIPQSLQRELVNEKPKFNLNFVDSEIADLIHSSPDRVKSAIKLWQSDIQSYLRQRNEQQLNLIKTDLKNFFNTVEKSPLTDEQIHAVVCMDDNNLVVASAGSGKTSTMVAKCAYAIRMEYFKPEQILMLAFNNDAASELRSRIEQRLKPLKNHTEKITTKTFHAFGLDFIGLATGKKPSIPSWLSEGKETETLQTMIDELKDRDLNFRHQWDLFRVVFPRDLPKFGEEEASPEWRDRSTNKSGFWTFNNELVKSRGELLIANWLFYNGVKYQYEAPYRHDTADSTHTQYTPDFYFPDIDLYYEHWAVDENGNPPKSFSGYAESMQWKKELHKKHGTQLIETTMAELWSGKAFQILQSSLTQRGVILDPNPDRPTQGRKVIQNERLIRMFRTFLAHVKNNQLTMLQLNQKLQSGVVGSFKFRHQVFLNLFEQIWKAWDDKLKSEKAIDFDDMLNMAADLIEQGKLQHDYQLIMVDEFQDVSQSRLRLIKALKSKKQQHLFAVGDDWQSINRFAGSYLGCMTEFDSNFGSSTILKLENTFRCPQSLCDISSQFVQKNPIQIKKKVISQAPRVETPIKIIRVKEVEFIQSAISFYLQEISSNITSESKQTVFVLGRHLFEKAYVPALKKQSNMSIDFMTVHKSKGLEADYIIIPNMMNETLGFPNQMEDDPVLSLAMPNPDMHKHSEERRLFYVALTRARKQVVLITVEKRESPFILELVKEHNLPFHDIQGEAHNLNVCPACGDGLVIPKKGPYGEFMACSNFPICDYKMKKLR